MAVNISHARAAQGRRRVSISSAAGESFRVFSSMNPLLSTGGLPIVGAVFLRFNRGAAV
ncbi:MAG: hypothetical protein ACE5F3_00960 [Mariprofundaceae bacterium]